MSKKAQKIHGLTVRVSQRNFNRVRHRTHTLERILALAGKEVVDGCLKTINHNGEEVLTPLNLIRLEPIPKGELVALKTAAVAPPNTDN